MWFKYINEIGDYQDRDTKEPKTLLVAESWIDSIEGRNVNCVEFTTIEEALDYFNLEVSNGINESPNG